MESYNCNFTSMKSKNRHQTKLFQELEKIYEGDVGEIFDIAEARGALVRRRESLVAECKACHEVRFFFFLSHWIMTLGSNHVDHIE